MSLIPSSTAGNRRPWMGPAISLTKQFLVGIPDTPRKPLQTDLELQNRDSRPLSGSFQSPCLDSGSSLSRTPLRNPITLAAAMAHCSSNQHTLDRLRAENARLRSQYYQLINTIMQKHPELGSPPVPDWCTIVCCKEEGRMLESQVEDISRRGSAGLDVTAEVFEQLRHDYGSLFLAHRNVLREQAVLDDDVKRLKRQFDTFTRFQKHPLLHCTEVCLFASLDTLYLRFFRILTKAQSSGWTMSALFFLSNVIVY